MTSTTLVPDYRQVTRLPRELGPLVIPEEFRDENDHMNVRHYFDLCIEAAGRVFDRIGITDDYRAERGQGFFTAEHHIRYYSETRVGDEVSAYFRGIERSDKVVHGMALLVNDTTERLACTLELVGIHVDLTSRSVTPFAPDTATAIDRELRSVDVAWSAPVCGAMGVRR
ncbi:thioesterase family protein [Nocardia brevicatena]|uniref:thioesterase family protein n=1 Tax=Nocardia brevicatena TaxID=37327 RepID=UPI0003009B9F|nr:thioesterase family protein [Nocardia brevicatena]